MHDSRGAALKIGDRVLIEAEITKLQEGDENFCCVDVQVVTPDQPNKDKVMAPPSFSAMSTKMLTKIGAVAMILLFIAATADACLGQRGGLRAQRDSRQSSCSGAVVQQVTTVRVQSFATGCSSANRQPLRRSGCASSVQMSTGCSSGYTAPALPASKK